MAGPSLFDRYVLYPRERPNAEIRHHHEHAPGRRYVLVNRDVLPDSDLYVIERRVGGGVCGDQEPYVDPHRHRCTSFYIFRGTEESPGSLLAEVKLESEVRVVESPCQVFIPAGLLHTVRIVRGPGTFTHVVLSGDYDGSLVGDDPA